MNKNGYEMRAEVWVYPGDNAWYFVTLPADQAALICKRYAAIKRGWGSLPVTVILGKSKWDTSIFPDKRSNSYLLPLKAEIRKKERVLQGDSILFTLKIRTDVS